MDCNQLFWPSNTEYLADFRRRTYQERIPISGGINLTNRCNLKCVHCYIRDYQCGEGQKPELDTDRILSILDEAVAAGCLFFLITGGEPLLHPDFSVIYAHARRLGMLVSVFTNGTLIDQSHIKLFSELPPQFVEITLYGATKETFDLVAGVAGAYEACHKGIKKLIAGRIPFRLKTMLLTLNKDELGAMEEYADGLNVPFRFDPLITPRLDGDLSPLQYRVSPHEAVVAEMADPERAQKRVEYDKTLGKPYRAQYLYRCGTGTTSFFVDAYGGLQPCLMVTDSSVDLKKESFAAAWKTLGRIREIESQADLPCRDCSELAYCGYCPPVMQLENGLAVNRESYICKLGHYRKQAVLDYQQDMS